MIHKKHVSLFSNYHRQGGGQLGRIMPARNFASGDS